jgi:hypothetical protein
MIMACIVVKSMKIGQVSAKSIQTRPFRDNIVPIGKVNIQTPRK